MYLSNKAKTTKLLKKELENICRAPLSKDKVEESYFNLCGFFDVLKKMKTETAGV